MAGTVVEVLISETDVKGSAPEPCHSFTFLLYYRVSIESGRLEVYCAMIL